MNKNHSTVISELGIPSRPLTDVISSRLYCFSWPKNEWSYTKAIISIPDTTVQPEAPGVFSRAVVLGTAHARNRETNFMTGSSHLDLRGPSREWSQQITVCNTL